MTLREMHFPQALRSVVATTKGHRTETLTLRSQAYSASYCACGTRVQRTSPASHTAQRRDARTIGEQRSGKCAQSSSVLLATTTT